MKAFIDNLTRERSNYGNPEQAINQANSLQLLSSDIYTDSKRFIYELLQNADDASNKNNKLDIKIEFLFDNLFAISHKGEPFSEIDIESISSAGDGNKTSDENKTGFKGIGFKSVFTYSDCVRIISGNFCFKFDKNNWIEHWDNNWDWDSKEDWQSDRIIKRRDSELKMPWQTIPIWENLSELDKYFKDYNVTTIIEHKHIDDLKNGIKDIFSKTQILLFLRCEDVKIEIVIPGDTSLVLEKNQKNGITTLKCNNTVLSEWLIKTEQFDIPNDVKATINQDEKAPKKLKNAKRYEISFAIQFENGKLRAVDEASSLIFTYLPTEVNYKFPFLVNANFLTDAGREKLHQDIFWNNWLFEQIPLKFFAWISELADKTSKYNKQILRIIPQKLSGFTELERSFNKGFCEAIEQIAFIPNWEGDLIKVKEAILDKTKINSSDFISKQTIIDYINDKAEKQFTIKAFVSSLDYIESLVSLGVRTLNVDDLEDFFDSEVFVKKHTVEGNFKLISFLYKQAEKNRSWNEKLKDMRFLFDETQKLQCPQHIYFPSPEFSEEINIIHKNILAEIYENQAIKNWLELLGVQEPSEISFIENTIIAQGETYVTTENAVQLGRYVFNAHKRGYLDEEHYRKLRRLKILTKEESLINAATAFLSDYYEPVLCLEKVYENDFYVSEEYLDKKDSKRDWASFLIKIGVSESIEWQVETIDRKNLTQKYTDYFSKIPSGSPYQTYQNDFFEYRVSKIVFIEEAIDYNFSKQFWKVVFVNNLNTNSSTADYGVHNFGQYGNRHIPLPLKLNDWLLKNHNIFPTTQKTCLEAAAVFSSEIVQIKEIAGKYLPVFDYDEPIPPSWSDYLNFKKSLKVEDYLTILAGIANDDNVSTCKELINNILKN